MPVLALPPIILGITRSPISTIPDPGMLTIEALKDWFNTYIKTLNPAYLGVEPENRIYVYCITPSLIPVDAVYSTDLKGQTDLALVQTQPPPTNPRNVLELSIQTVFSNIGVTVGVTLMEICVSVPDMARLETSSQYRRNAILMGLSIQVRNSNGDQSEPSLPLPVWLPGPLMGKPDWKNSTVFGGKDHTNPSPERVCNFLGQAAKPDSAADVNAKFGQIRWYSIEMLDLPNFDALRYDLFNFLHHVDSLKPDPKLALSLPDSIARPLAEIRRMGAWIIPSPDPNSYWGDDWVTFKIPTTSPGLEIPGFIVIWRDDIPSRLIPYGNLEEYARLKIKTLAEKIWRPIVNSQPVTGPTRIHIPVGDLVRVGAERLVEEANNVVASCLGNSLTVRFTFMVVDASDGFLQENLKEENGTKYINGDFQPIFDPCKVGVSDTTLDFRYQPKISHVPLSPEKAGAFSLQLRIQINGIVTLFNKPFSIQDLQVDIGIPIVFEPDALVIPTLAIFFYHHFFGGPALVMLPKNTGLFGKDKNGNNIEVHIDADTPGQFIQEKQSLLAQMNLTLDLLKRVQVFWKNETYQLFTTILGEFIAKGMSVVDSSGAISQLDSCMVERRNWPSDNIHFHDSISSAILVGVPYTYSHTVVKCYEHTGFNKNNEAEQKNGKILNLLIPDGCFIAAIPSFVNLHVPYQIQNLDPEHCLVSLPYGNPALGQPGGPDPDFVDFNDKVSSILIE